jgi:dihydrofolate reductase
MGRNMFGPGRGEWDLAWKGWWGDEPPYHAPVIVLTHHAREPLTMEGGTTFHFVTDGLDSALEQAKAAADGKHVEIAGGASTVNAYLGAGVVEELHLHTSPVLLGAGERLSRASPPGCGSSRCRRSARPEQPTSSTAWDRAPGGIGRSPDLSRQT